MAKIEVELSEDLKQILDSRTKELGMNASIYFNALLLEDITKQQLKETKDLENKIIKEVYEIHKLLEKN